MFKRPINIVFLLLSCYLCGAVAEVNIQENVIQKTPLGGYCTTQDHIPFVNPQNNYAQGCLFHTKCPSGYHCEASTSGQLLCCGRLGSVPYPNYVPVLDAASHAIPCGHVGASFACPGQSSCLPTSKGPPNQLICTTLSRFVLSRRFQQRSINPPMNTMSQRSVGHCPQGLVEQRRSLGGRLVLISCSLSVPAAAACRQPGVCLSSQIAPSLSVCCESPGSGFPSRPRHADNLCPGHQQPLLAQGSVVRCLSEQSGLPCLGSNAFTCQKPLGTIYNGFSNSFGNTIGSTSGAYICCGLGELVNALRCPNSERGPLLMGIYPLNCSPRLQNCPSNYECVVSPSNSHFVCCPGDSGTLAGTLCRDGSVPDKVGGLSETCNPRSGLETCNLGFTCQLTRSPRVNACCPTPVCPGGGRFVPEITCTSTSSNCGRGNICEETSRGQFDCCSNGRLEPGFCPNNGILDTTPEGRYCSRERSRAECNSGYLCTRTDNNVLGCCLIEGV